MRSERDEIGNVKRVGDMKSACDGSSTRRRSSWRVFLNSLIAAEVSTIGRFFERILFLGCDMQGHNLLYEMIDAPERKQVNTIQELDLELSDTTAAPAVVLNGRFNHDYDVEGVLHSLWKSLSRSSRIIAVMYNPYLRWAYSLANRMGFRRADLPSTFLTSTDLKNIASLSGFEVTRIRAVGFFPWRLGGVGTVLNRICAALPLVRYAGFAWVVVLRPVKPSNHNPSLSIVIPARNERGNIEAALQRMPDLGVVPEVIFVEGHSKDGTWEEIERVADLYRDRFPIKCFRQTGRGKADAVRLGFSKASGELLTILDADLTMPPELLGRFYNAWTKGLADFINGNRLVYPIEGEAMKFLNWLGNIFFAKALSFVLDTRLGDSLCGTKLMSRRDYERFVQWREEFGDFDPFGDFELIFPACSLGLGVIDIPIRYRDRVYGSTNIRRFYHGLMLFKMTWIGLCRLKLGARPRVGG